MDKVLIVIEQSIPNDDNDDSKKEPDYISLIRISIKYRSITCFLMFNTNYSIYDSYEELCDNLRINDVVRITEPHIHYINNENEIILITKVSSFDLAKNNHTINELSVWLEKISYMTLQDIISSADRIQKIKIYIQAL